VLALQITTHTDSQIDEATQTDLVAIAQHLMAAKFSIAEAPHLNGLLTHQQIKILIEDVLNNLFPGWFHNNNEQIRSLETTNSLLARIRDRLSGYIDATLAVTNEPLLQSTRLDTQQVVHEFLAGLPDIRRVLIDDA